MWKRMAVFCLGLGLVGTMACVEDDVEEGPEGLTQTGMNLTVDIQGDSDVAGFRYIISECGKNGKTVLEEDKDLEDMTLPGGIPAFIDAPFDEESKHLFADNYMTLAPGCYDVTVKPITKKGKKSKDCSIVKAKGVKVKEGKTREILLVSQCNGEASVGALDVVAGLNFPPQLKKVTYDTSKFLTCSDREVVICAEAYDPDRDPMVFEWEQKAGGELKYGPQVIYSSQKKGVKKECVKVKFKKKADDYLFRVTAFDQFHGKKGLITAEKWFQKNGYGTVKSRATMKAPVYLSCDKKPQADTCPNSQGFWKNHLYLWPEGTKNQKLFGWVSWKSVLFSPPVGGDMCYILGKQYVAARLNQAYGAKTPDNVEDAFKDAEKLMDKHCPGLTGGYFGNKQKRKEAEELKDLFEDYNQGEYQTPYCEEIDTGNNNSGGDGDNNVPS